MDLRNWLIAQQLQDPLRGLRRNSQVRQLPIHPLGAVPGAEGRRGDRRGRRNPGVQLAADVSQQDLDLLLVEGLDAEPQNTVLNDPLGILKLAVAADDHEPDLRKLRPGLLDQVQAANSRHPDIGKHQLRLKLPDFFQALPGAACLAAGGEAAGFPGDPPPQTGQDQPFVVN